MAVQTCSSCGRSLLAYNSPNGENPCVVCVPIGTKSKPIKGVSPVSVVKEDVSQRTPEAIEAKQGKCRAKYKNGNPCRNKAVKDGLCNVHG